MRKFFVIALFLVMASPAAADGEAGIFGADISASKLVGSLLTGPHRKTDLPPGISGRAFDRRSAGLVLPSKMAFDLICRVVNVPLPMPDLLAVSRPMTDREKAACAANGVSKYVEIPWVEGHVEGVSASNKVVSHYLYVNAARVPELPLLKSMVEALVAEDVVGPGGNFETLPGGWLTVEAEGAYHSMKLVPTDEATRRKARDLAAGL